MKNWFKIFFFVLLVLVFILFIWFHISRAQVYAKIGSFYAGKGNYVTAQNYYEKSYSLGNSNNEFREKYVNLLINSPLTIEAQERLVAIAEDKSNDSASESARYFLYNLRREILNKYPDNYIQQASYNKKIIHWGKMPITYSFKQTKGVPSDIAEAVNDAFDAWERASSARIRFERTSMNADIVVGFTNYTIKSPKIGEKYVIAYTLPNITSNRLNRMDITLNLSSIDGKPFTSNQMYNTALHEIFHALGLMGHSFEKDNIMYVDQTNEWFVNDERRKISDADKSTLELLYKIRPDITNSNDLHYDYIPYPIIGDDADISYAKIEEAKKYIRKAPNIPSGYVDLAQALINQKDYEGAVSSLQKALFLSKSDESKSLVLHNLALVHFFENDYEMAVFYANKALELKKDEEIHVLLAEIYKSMGDEKNIIKEYSYLITQNPDNIEYVINLANIYISKRDYLKARKVLKDYIKRNPQEKKNPRFSPCKLLLL